MRRLEAVINDVRRGSTPLHASLKRAATSFLHYNVPVPRLLYPFLRFLGHLSGAVYFVCNRVITTVYRYPVFRSFCYEVGPRLYLEQLPSVSSRVQIRIGSDVRISGAFGVMAASVFESPALTIGNRVFIGHGTSITVGSSVAIEDDVLIAGGCTIFEYSSHPLDADERAGGCPPMVASAKGVRIHRKAWIGKRAFIMPGVTIGEGAVIGAGSVVTRDVPPFHIAAGNPARVIRTIETTAKAPEHSE